MNKIYKLYLLTVIIVLNLLVSTSIYAMEEGRGVAAIAELKKQYAAFKKNYESKDLSFLDKEVADTIENGIDKDVRLSGKSKKLTDKEYSHLNSMNKKIIESRDKGVSTSVAFITYLQEVTSMLNRLSDAMNNPYKKEKFDEESYNKAHKKVKEANECYTNLLHLYLLSPAKHCIFRYVKVNPDNKTALDNAATIGGALAGLFTLNPYNVDELLKNAEELKGVHTQYVAPVEEMMISLTPLMKNFETNKTLDKNLLESFYQRLDNCLPPLLENSLINYYLQKELYPLFGRITLQSYSDEFRNIFLKDAAYDHCLLFYNMNVKKSLKTSLTEDEAEICGKLIKDVYWSFLRKNMDNQEHYNLFFDMFSCYLTYQESSIETYYKNIIQAFTKAQAIDLKYTSYCNTLKILLPTGNVTNKWSAIFKALNNTPGTNNLVFNKPFWLILKARNFFTNNTIKEQEAAVAALSDCLDEIFNKSKKSCFSVAITNKLDYGFLYPDPEIDDFIKLLESKKSPTSNWKFFNFSTYQNKKSFLIRKNE